MQELQIQITEGVGDAPNYNKGHRINGIKSKPAEFHTVVIVPKGTEAGKCTVDFQILIKNPAGEYEDAAVVMTTGAIICALADIIRGVEARTGEQG